MTRITSVININIHELHLQLKYRNSTVVGKSEVCSLPETCLKYIKIHNDINMWENIYTLSSNQKDADRHITLIVFALSEVTT